MLILIAPIVQYLFKNNLRKILIKIYVKETTYIIIKMQNNLNQTILMQLNINLVTTIEKTLLNIINDKSIPNNKIKYFSLNKTLVILE